MVNIRAETAADHAGIRALLTAAFGADVEADLVDELRAEGYVVTALVASDAIGVAGYVLFSDLAVEIDGRDIAGVVLAPLAVRADQRRQGLGGRLVATGLDVCRKSGKQLALVLGDPDYYGKFGFAVETARGLKTTLGGPALQALELEARARGQGQGSLVYPSPFDRFT